MNTSPRLTPAHASVLRVHDVFMQTFLGAVPRHRDMLFREWARLAAVPSNAVGDWIFRGFIEADGRRLLLAEPTILQRIADVAAGRVHPLPDWAQNHRKVDGPMVPHKSPLPTQALP